jgi:hypothetical protein
VGGGTVVFLLYYCVSFTWLGAGWSMVPLANSHQAVENLEMEEGGAPMMTSAWLIANSNTFISMLVISYQLVVTYHWHWFC